ncbi:MAG: hypothetical protein IPM84_20325 [Anaerolineae bacterium]|nr:hypothetical protein [Anaerolineae bacterium]
MTGWPAAAVEFFERLVTTQNVNHVRPHALRCPTFETQIAFGFLGPFDRTAHTADVRHIDNGRGKHNIPNVGLFLWRLQAYHIDGVTARQVASNDERRYAFSPPGKNQSLYHLARTEDSITQMAQPLDVPLALSRRFLLRNLDACYGRERASKPADPRGGQVRPIGDILVCDLSDKQGGDGAFTAGRQSGC